MNTIRTTRRLNPLRFIDLSSWTLGCLTACIFFSLQAWLADPPEVDEAQVTEGHDVQLLNEVGAIAREAHAQGMREALASVRGTPDGEALQRSCARLWGMEHEQ